MKRSLAIALALFALSGGIAPWTGALGQWGPPPGTPGGPPPGASGAFGGPPGGPPGSPQGQCADFPRLSAEAKKRADAVQAAINAKVDRKQVCMLMISFTAAETNVIKFLEDNKTWCGVPDQAIAVSKANHEKSLKFRTMACNNDAAPVQKPPTLSDAIKTPSVDSATNTKTGRGTFDTLTGNPLAR